jgi:ubiquinone biosynthesis protein UbiJ
MFAEAQLLSLIDRLLSTQPTARARLMAHAGKTARIALPIGGLTFTLDEHGSVAASAPDCPPDTTITLPADIPFRLALGEKDALRQSRIEGDGLLASDLSAALDGFDWALAMRPVFGDIAAARIDQAIAGFGAWRAKAHEAIGQAFAEYSVHEAGMLASKPAIERFSTDVDALRDDVARLEARLDFLEAKRRGD